MSMKTKTKDSIGDRMKSYEAHETSRRSMKRLPICVRVDGRAFHTFTRGLARPFDEGFSEAMVETCKFLVEQTHAKIGYTQSDEAVSVASVLIYLEPGAAVQSGQAVRESTTAHRLLAQPFILPTVAKVLILIGTGLILRRLLPVIEESKTLV